MKGLLITSLIVLGLMCAGAAGAVTTLSDTELAGVSGGGADPHLGGQSLPQDQQQPESNSSGYTPPRDPQSIDGMDLPLELFAILQSRIDAERERRLLLNGTTQRDAIALNLDNVLSSDAVSTANIFDGGSITLDDITTGVEVNQTNDLSQLHRYQGSLDSSVAGHWYEKTVESRSGRESYEYHAYSFIDQDRVSEHRSVSTRGNQVEVGRRFTSLEEMKEAGIISKLELDLLNLLGFRVDELNLGAGVEIKGSGEVAADTGFFRLRGEATLELCFFAWCVEVDVDLVKVNEPLNVMGNVDIAPGDPGDTVDTADRDDDLVAEYKAIDVAESAFNESYERSVFTGGQMTGAEAELLALSDGTLSVDNISNVTLLDGSQQNMRVFNGVNAVSAIVANSLNLGKMPSLNLGAAGRPQVTMQQQNRFDQQR